MNWARADSVVRRAFAAGAAGHHGPIALDAYPDQPVADRKIDRQLGGGEHDDLNPHYLTLDLAGQHNPEAVLEVLCEAWGFEPPRRRPADPAELLGSVLDAAREIQQAQDEISAVLERVAKMAPKPAVRVVSRRRRESA